MRYTLGISTCPNDTFMFHALLERRISCDGFELDVELMDVQRLNEGIARSEFHFSKASCFAAALVRDRYEVCESGAALGFGVGPVVLTQQGASVRLSDARILTPGGMTTAYLLFRHFFPKATNIEQALFSEIMPALERGEADYGVVIHEGRFTYGQHGLSLVHDLGSLWEEEFSLPLPLGCIVADRRIPEVHRRAFTHGVRSSIEYSYAHRDEALLTMKRHAQEMEESVILRHVDLYVNNWSLNLGEEGHNAMSEFDKLVDSLGGLQFSGR